MSTLILPIHGIPKYAQFRLNVPAAIVGIKLIAYLKERFGEDISDSEIKNVLRSNEDIDKLVQEAKEKQRKKRSIIGITRDIPEDKFTKFHEWEEKGET